MRCLARWAWMTGAGLAWASNASAQLQPPPPLPYPPQPYPAQQPPAPQPYPAPPAPAPQPYPPQAYPPAQPYQPLSPPAPAPPPVYPQPAPVYGPAPMPAPYYPPPRPAPSPYRSPNEMAFLYGVGAAYGVGTGIWLDALGHLSDPGLAIIAPLILGAAAPVGVYVWDQQREFDRGVPSSIATGLLLGGVEGVAVSGLQWQLTGNGGPHTWDFRTWTSITFATSTLGGIGGFVFGEWIQPDPRSLALIASASGWGAMTGVLFGSGVVSGNSDWTDGAAVWGFAGYNLGILAAGVASTVYVPSYETIKYMWAGETLGILATMPIYIFYVNGGEIRHGLIANAVGGLAGLTIATLLTYSMSDPPGTAAFTPPFQLAVAPAPGVTPNSTARNGGELTVYGTF
jgi:hypothetical protein